MKKGFTLIELLAVIVILAIIALIATPIVLNIINETKESTVLRSADFYLDAVERSIVLSTLNNIEVKDGTYPIIKDGNVCIGKLDDGTCIGDILEIDIDGEVPKEGTITITNSQITSIKLNYNNKVVIKDENGKLVYKPESKYKTLSELAVVSSKLGVKDIENCTKKGEICELDEDGVAFAIKVNDSETYKFYVLKDDGDEVTLIMSENLGEDVEWVKEEDSTECKQVENDYDENGIIEEEEVYEFCYFYNKYGPLTALEALKTRTSNWTNITEYSYELNYGPVYECVADNCGDLIELPEEGKITVTNVRTRLLELSDIPDDLLYNNGTSNFLPSPGHWLSGEYWLSNTGYSVDHAFSVYHAVETAMSIYYEVIRTTCYINEKNGIRPVITIAK